MNKIAEMWQWAELVCHEPKELDPKYGVLNFTPMNNKDDYGFIAEFSDKILFAFRGTKGKLEPWIQNFDPYPLKDDGKVAYIKDTLKGGLWGDGMIHDGFYTAWSFFKDPVTQYLKAMNEKKDIYCTGHSRGGALSTLCSRHIAKNLGMPCSCISYGAPSQGIAAYRDQYNLLPIYHTRVVNGYDIVPNLPPYDLGFRHVGILMNLSQPAWHKWFHRIRDHFYTSYTKAIKKYSLGKGDKEAVALMDQVLRSCEREAHGARYSERL